MSTKYFLGARILLNILSASSYLTLTVLQVMDYILHCTEETKVPRGFTICPKSRGQLSLVWLPNLCAELLPNTPFLSQPESQKTYLPLSESPPAVALTQPIPRLPHENSLLSPYAQVQWQVHRCPLTNVHFKAVINLLESELLPPTWAIFQPFSGIIIRNKDVNISSPQPGKRARGHNLGDFPVGSCALGNSVESGLSGDTFGEVEPISCLPHHRFSVT